MEIALVSVTSLVALDNHTCHSAKVVLGAVAPTFIHAPKTEEFLTGKVISEPVVEQAGDIASQECSPITDVRASADYRRQLVRVLTKRTISEAVAHYS